MARPIKKGLDYFPFDVNFFKDIKLRKLIKYQGCKATPVYTLLLCNIYENGYYIRWDNELPFIISEITGYEEGYVKEVINCCLNVQLFSKKMFDEKKILTSKGIQERYKLICQQIKRNSDIREFNLINSEETGVNSEETGVNSEETGVNSEETGVNSEESTQRKRNEKKIKENKNQFDLNFCDPEFYDCFSKFLDYRKKIREEFKTQMSVEASYRLLLELSTRSPTVAEKIVEQSIANQWKGLFRLNGETKKNNQNGETKQNRFDEALNNLNNILRK